MAKKVKLKKENMATDEVKRHMSVLMEHMEKEVKVIAGQYGSIQEDMSQVKSELKTVKIAVMENSRDIKRVEKKLDTALDNHEKRIQKLEHKVGI